MATQKEAGDRNGLKSLKLLPPTKIRALEEKTLTAGATFVDGVKTVTLQWVMHAEKHGDHTPLRRWFQNLHEQTEGFVTAALYKWVRDHSPIVLSLGSNGQVDSKVLKEGETGYRPYNTGDMEAERETILKTEEVKNRTNRPIEEMSIKMLKRRILGFKRQLEKAQEQGGRGVIGHAAVIEQWIDDLAKVPVRPVVVKDAKGKEKTIAFDEKKEEQAIEKAMKAREAQAKKVETVSPAKAA